MKLTVLLSSLGLLAAGAFASPVETLETRVPDGNVNLLVSRDNGLKCADRMFSVDYLG